MTKTKTQSVAVSQRLAPEDIRRGDYVAISRTICQLIPDGVTAGWSKSLKTIELPYIPCDAGEPMKVVAVCLPFVFVKTIYNGHDTLDVRHDALVKLTKDFGKRAFKATRPPTEKTDDGKKRKKKNKGKKNRKK